MKPYQIQPQQSHPRPTLDISSPIKIKKINSSFSKNNKKSPIIFDSFAQHDQRQNLNQYFQNTDSFQFGQVDTKQKKQKEMFKLQELLQKQYLMLQKQQTQKTKFVKEIQTEMKNYYSLLIQIKGNSKSNLQYDQQPQSKGNQSKDSQNGTQTLLTLKSQSKIKPINKIIKDDGFDNCYNFIKQVVINTSKNIEVAINLLLNCTISYSRKQKGSVFINDYKMLVDLFVNIFYQRVSETDPILKDVTKLISTLLTKLITFKEQQKQKLIEKNKLLVNHHNSKQNKQNYMLFTQIKTNYQKIQYIFNQYMEKQQIQDYFQIISNKVLKKIQKISFSRAQTRNRSGVSLSNSKSIIMDSQSNIQLDRNISDTNTSFANSVQQNWLQYIKPFQSFTDQKRSLAMTFLSYVYSEADLCPINLKIILKHFYEVQLKYYQEKYHQIKSKYEIKQMASLRVWELIQRFYLKRFQDKNKRNNKLMQNMSGEQLLILNDVLAMIRSFLNPNGTQMFVEDQQLSINYTKSKKFITKLVQKLLNFNDQKYQLFKQSIEGTLEKQQKAPSLKRTKTQMSCITKVESTDNTSYRSTIQLVDKADQSRTQVTGSRQPSQLSSDQNMVDMDCFHTHKQLRIKLPPQLIKIYGGCISLKQLHVLLTCLMRIKDKIPSQRIRNRVQRIFDMSPDLQFLVKPKNISSPNQVYHLFVILLQIQYDPLIQNDYKKIYLKQYEDNKIKNIIRQIMCELKLNQFNRKVNKRQIVNKKKVNIFQYELEDFKMMKKEKTSPIRIKENQLKQKNKNNVLLPLLQQITYQCSKSVQGSQMQYSLYKGVSIQIIKRIQYLLYLFQKKTSQFQQHKILKEMLEQVKYRNQKMRKLYQHTKFGLLAVIGNIRHYRNLLISKKEIQQKVNIRIGFIRVLERLDLNLCLTSPFTRTNPQFNQRDLSPTRLRENKSLSPNQSPRNTTNILKDSFSKTKNKISTSQINPTQVPKQKEKSNQLFFEPFNRYKYRISNADQIVLCQTLDCIHKDNIFIGLNYHINSISQFIFMFCKMREVSQNMFFAKFIIPESVSQHVQKQISQQLKHLVPINHNMASIFLHPKYPKLNFSLDKINKIIYHFFEYLINQKISLNLQHKASEKERKQQINELQKVIKDVIFRGIHEKLVKRMQKKISVKNYKQTRNNSIKNKSNNKSSNYNEETTSYNNGEETMFQHFDVQDNKDVDKQGLDLNDNRLTMNKNSSQSQSQKPLNHNESMVINNGSQISSQPNIFVQQSIKKQTSYSNSKRQLQKKNMFIPQNKSKKHSSIEQNCIYQSKNDQILLYQIKKISNSKQFQFNYYNVTHSGNHQATSQKDVNKNHDQINHTNQQAIHLKQLQQVCARYIKSINKKTAPDQKIELLKSITDIYKLVVKQKSTHPIKNYHKNSQQSSNKLDFNNKPEVKSSDSYFVSQENNLIENQINYSLDQLIFRSIVLAEPINFITNLAFIEMFLHRDKMLSIEGKILNHFKKIANQIFQMKDIQHYIGHKKRHQNQGKRIQDDGQMKTIIQNIKIKALRESIIL